MYIYIFSPILLPELEHKSSAFNNESVRMSAFSPFLVTEASFQRHFILAPHLQRTAFSIPKASATKKDRFHQVTFI